MEGTLLIRSGGLAAVVGGVAWVALWLPGNILVGVLRPLGLLPRNASAIDEVVYVLLLLDLLFYVGLSLATVGLVGLAIATMAARMLR